MAGTALQSGSRRAWGAAPPPRPAAEQRRVLEAEAAPAAGTVPAGTGHPMPSTHAPPRSKQAMPRLPGTRLGDDGSQRQQHRKSLLVHQQQGAGLSPATTNHRGKQQLVAGSAAGTDEAVQQEDTIPAQRGAAWAAAMAALPLLPSLSPDALPGLPQLAAAVEEDDTVLIGSTAPSFTQPALPAPVHQQPQQQAAAADPTSQGQQPPNRQRNSGSGTPSAAASPRLSQRASLLGPQQVDAENLSLSALAANSRRSTRQSSVVIPLVSRRSNGVSDKREPGPEQATAGGTAREAGPQARQPGAAQHPTAKLSSGELAVLRQSMVELQLHDSSGGVAAGGGSKAEGESAEGGIPDALVLQALSSRLGRLDSQKRRVLLAVLAKIDGMDSLDSLEGDGAGGSAQGPAGATEGEGAALVATVSDDAVSQLIASSLGNSPRRMSVVEGLPAGAGASAAPAEPGLQASSGSSNGSNSNSITSASGGSREAPVGKAQPQQHAVVPGSPQPEQPSSKQVMEKLAGLRLGRANSLLATLAESAGVDADGSPFLASPNAAVRQPSPTPQQVLQQALQQQMGGSAMHAHSTTKLQSMVQQRHRERSRLSGDGMRGARNSVHQPSHLSPAGSVAPLSNPMGGDALSAFAAEHQSFSPAPPLQLDVTPTQGPLLQSSTDSAPGVSVGDSLELFAQPSQLDVVTAGNSPSLLSARGQLSRSTTLPVGPQPGSPANRQLLSAAAGVKASPADAAAAAVLIERLTSASGSSRANSVGTSSSSALVHCQELTLVLLDTWGDSHFVGLTGLQLLGADGQPLSLAADQLAADPPDLNVFPGHSGDVRTLDKLVNGENNTMDDAHMWLAPVKRQLSAAAAAAASQRNAAQWAALPEAVQPYNLLSVRLPAGGAWLSGLRVWNYNKSPQDTARGVKRMLVLADGLEVSPPGGALVRRGPGSAALPFGQLISLNTSWAAAAAAAATGSRLPPGSGQRREAKRATQQGPRQPAAAAVAAVGQQAQALSIHSESVAWVCNMQDPAAALEYLQRAALLAKASGPGGSLVTQPGENFATLLPCGFSLRLVLISSWGCPHYLGLTGLEVQDAVRGTLRIRPDQVSAVPASVAQLPGMSSDVRTPDKLVNGQNSGAPQHSWLAPLDPLGGNEVHIMLDTPVLLGALRVWNYAKTPSRGVQQLEVYLDEHLVFKGLLQRAPAEVSPGQDFSQTLCFSEEAMAEASATTRRRAAATARGRGGKPGAGGSSLPGDPLGVEGVEEWCQAQERVILVNEGQFVAFPPDEAAGPASARPGTSVVAT